MSETGYMIGFRQQLSTTSFEGCEMEIMVNYFTVYTWTENFSFMGNLTSWPMFFSLSFWPNTRSSTATWRTQSTAAWLQDSCTHLVASVQQTVDASNFPTLVGQFTQQPSCTILLWQIEIFNQNFCRFGSWQFPKVK